MKIGYDAKRAFLNNTGLGNYSRWLIKAMATYHPQQSYYLYTPKIKPNSRLNFLSQFGNIKTIAAPNKLLSPWWRSKGVVKDLKRDHIQLYHGLSHELPLDIQHSGVKSVVTVHDLIFMRFPQYFGWINRLIYGAKLRYACNAADKVVVISQKTKDDLMELLHVEAHKIEVIYQGCDPVFSQAQQPEKLAEVKQKYQLPGSYLLTVGTIEERKNLLLLVKALTYTDQALVVVGKPTKYLDVVKSFISEHNLASRVTFLHQVNFEDLPAVYQLANIFIYPSRYEGFGIPVLEALNAGVPVIAAKGSCLEEAGGPDSLYTDPNNEKELADKINQVWNDVNLQQHMIARGRKYARQFDDEKLASQLMQLYQNTLKDA